MSTRGRSYTNLNCLNKLVPLVTGDAFPNLDSKGSREAFVGPIFRTLVVSTKNVVLRLRPYPHPLQNRRTILGMVFGLVTYSGKPIFSQQPSFQPPKPDSVMDEFPVDDPAAWEADGIMTLLQYLIGYTEVVSPFRRGINGNKTFSRDSLHDLSAIFLIKESDYWVIYRTIGPSAYFDTIFKLFSCVFVPVWKEVFDIELVGLSIGIHKNLGDKGFQSCL